MPTQWFNNRDEIFRLAEFLIDTGLIATPRDVIDYFRDPGKYTGVWRIFKTEILGEEIIIASPVISIG